MSSIPSTAPRSLPRSASAPAREPPAVKVLEWATAIPVVATLSYSLIRYEWTLDSEFLLWGLTVLVADLLPIPIWREVRLSLSLPVLLAASMVFQPFEAGLIALLASVDTREFARQVSVGRALHNRCQVALSVTAASAVFYAVGGDTSQWPEVLVASALLVLVDFIVNILLILPPIRLTTSLGVKEVLRGMVADSPGAFFLGYVAFGLLGLLLATVFDAVGLWGLPAFMIPVLLARQSFLYWRRYADAARSLEISERAVASMSREVAAERRDERHVIAGELHDEVLPPIYQVHLMGQVLRQDLARGQLLALDDDLPQLLAAADRASNATRKLIRDLRRSGVGAGGLLDAVRLLAKELREQTSARVEFRVEDVKASPLVQLMAYQIIREAARNAVKHSGATEIRIAVSSAPGGIHASVRDNGGGFDPGQVDRELHFGLDLMRERARSVGGDLYLDANPHQGTRVTAWLPADSRKND